MRQSCWRVWQDNSCLSQGRRGRALGNRHGSRRPVGLAGGATGGGLEGWAARRLSVLGCCCGACGTAGGMLHRQGREGLRCAGLGHALVRLQTAWQPQGTRALAAVSCGRGAEHGEQAARRAPGESRNGSTGLGVSHGCHPLSFQGPHWWMAAVIPLAGHFRACKDQHPPELDPAPRQCRLAGRAAALESARRLCASCCCSRDCCCSLDCCCRHCSICA